MNEEKCSGSCSQCGGCHGCSEKVTLSCKAEISFVSTITFSARNYQNSKYIRLVMECAKKGNDGSCYAGIKFFKDGKLLCEDQKKYTVNNQNLECLNLDFTPVADSDKAEVRVFCLDGATLQIEHINVINID